MSDPIWDLVLKILAIVLPTLIGLLGAWNISQGQRITSMNVSREQDRKDAEELRNSLKYWHDEADRNLEDLKAVRTDNAALNSSYVALATKHDETRSQLKAISDLHTSLNVRFEKKVTELDQVRADLSKQTDSLTSATSTIDSLHNALLSERASHDDALTRMNNTHAEKQDKLQQQINSLTEQLKRAEADIATLRNQLSEYDTINMKLAGEIRELERERDAWQTERRELLAQGKLANQKLSALRHEQAVIANPDNPVQTDADHAVNVANDTAASLPVPPDDPTPSGDHALSALPSGGVIKSNDDDRPPDPKGQAPIPVDFDLIVTLPKTGTNS